jgi:ankyrin repeat protein
MWNKVKPSTITQRLPHFQIDSGDNMGNTLYHWLIATHKDECLDALQTALSYDKASGFDKANTAGLTPLHMACANDSPKVVKFLVSKGAKVDKVDTERGWIPLHFAAYIESSACVEALLEAPQMTSNLVNAKSLTFQQTPLFVAAHNGRLKTVNVLLNSGKCEASTLDACGEQALHHAIKQEAYPVSTVLLKSTKGMEQESGLGLNVVDTAMAMLLQPFISHRQDSNSGDAKVSPQTTQIFVDVEKKLRNDRKLCQLADVNSFSRIMIENANAMTDASKKKLSRWHRNENNASFDIHTADEIGITWQFAAFSESASSSESSSEESEEAIVEDAPTSLKGLTIALSGTLSMKRADCITLIKKNGGTYATSVTKAVTHVVVQDPTEITSKITEAKAAGKKIVGEDFFVNLK